MSVHTEAGWPALKVVERSIGGSIEFAPGSDTEQSEPEAANQEADVDQHALLSEWNANREIQAEKDQQ